MHPAIGMLRCGRRTGWSRLGQANQRRSPDKLPTTTVIRRSHVPDRHLIVKFVIRARTYPTSRGAAPGDGIRAWECRARIQSTLKESKVENNSRLEKCIRKRRVYRNIVRNSAAASFSLMIFLRTNRL